MRLSEAVTREELRELRRKSDLRALATLVCAWEAHGARVLQRASPRPSAVPLPSRRAACGGLAAAALSPLLSAGAAEDESLIDVYFGCGCFWHVQHEFVEAERRILGRKDAEITARAGYAGGNGGAKNGKVCSRRALLCYKL